MYHCTLGGASFKSLRAKPNLVNPSTDFLVICGVWDRGRRRTRGWQLDEQRRNCVCSFADCSRRFRRPLRQEVARDIVPSCLLQQSPPYLTSLLHPLSSHMQRRRSTDAAIGDLLLGFPCHRLLLPPPSSSFLLLPPPSSSCTSVAWRASPPSAPTVESPPHPRLGIAAPWFFRQPHRSFVRLASAPRSAFAVPGLFFSRSMIVKSILRPPPPPRGGTARGRCHCPSRSHRCGRRGVVRSRLSDTAAPPALRLPSSMTMNATLGEWGGGGRAAAHHVVVGGPGVFAPLAVTADVGRPLADSRLRRSDDGRGGGVHCHFVKWCRHPTRGPCDGGRPWAAFLNTLRLRETTDDVDLSRSPLQWESIHENPFSSLLSFLVRIHSR